MRLVAGAGVLHTYLLAAARCNLAASVTWSPPPAWSLAPRGASHCPAQPSQPSPALPSPAQPSPAQPSPAQARCLQNMSSWCWCRDAALGGGWRGDGDTRGWAASNTPTPHSERLVKIYTSGSHEAASFSLSHWLEVGKVLVGWMCSR